MSQSFLVALAAGLVIGHLLASYFATRATGGSRDHATRMTLRVGVAITALVAVVFAGDASGLLSNFEARPPWLPRFVMPIFALTLFVGAVSSYGRRLALGLPIFVLVGVQVFRIPVELLLHLLYLEGVAAVEITYLGRNFDIVAGLTASSHFRVLNAPVIVTWPGVAP